MLFSQYLNTPLIVACLNTNPRCVSILINSGADIETSNKDGLAALDVAVVVDSLDIVQLLLNSDPPANVHRVRVSFFVLYSNLMGFFRHVCLVEMSTE